MTRRYIFFDIDGTLLTGGYENGYVPESAKEAIRELRAAGHFLAIATGRSHAMAVGHMRRLGFENMVSDGGYGITIENRLLGIRPLQKEQAVALIRECDKKDIPWGLQLDDSDTRFAPDGRFYACTKDTYLKTQVVPGLRPEEQEYIFKMYIACEYPCEYSLEALKPLPWCRYHDSYFFVEPTYKDVGIRTIMDYFHADYRDVIVFGDAENDLSMFTDDWLKVAMGNAVPALKAKADLVTSDVDKHGIYNACVKLGLINGEERS